jgi:hypothetical protein
LAHFVGEGGEFFGEDGLHAVGERFVRFVVDFDEQAIGADSHGGAGERENFVALAGTVTGVDEDGEVAAFFYSGHDGEVQSVAGKIGEGAHAAFAKHDVVVAFGENVFGGHQKFVESGGHAALEQDGLLGVAGALQEREILHVARADLDDVGVLFDEVEGFAVNRFGDYAEAVSGADFREDLEAGFAEALEAVRRSARLVGAPAEEACAGLFDSGGDGEALLLGFDGAGAGDQGDVPAADKHVARRRGYAQDGVFFLGLAANKFVGLTDGDAFGDAGKRFEDAKVHDVFVAGNADGRAVCARHGMRFEAEAFDASADCANLFLGGVGLHDDEHGRPPGAANAG